MAAFERIESGIPEMDKALDNIVNNLDEKLSPEELEVKGLFGNE